MTLLDQMRNRIQRLNGAEKLILLNVLCFILPLFFNTVLFLFNIQTDFYVGWFELSASLSELLFKPWTLVSYSFMHSGFFHLFGICICFSSLPDCF